MINRKYWIRSLRLAYFIIPFKYYILSLLRLFYKPTSLLLNNLSFSGIFKVKFREINIKIINYTIRGFTLENSLFWYGISEKNNFIEIQSVDLWYQLSKKSKVIMDIGANTGFYSLLAKAVNSESRVIGFEPVKHIFNCYEKNIEINNFKIESYNMAVSYKNQSSNIFYENTNKNIYSASLDKKFAESHSSKKISAHTVKSIAIDKFIQEKQISNLDLLKIDVEGHEESVLNGMVKCLKNFKPTLLIEILTDELGTKVQKILDNYGYLYFNLNKNDKPLLSKDITASGDHNYLICTKEVAKSLHLI